MSYRPHVAHASARANISPWHLIGISVMALLCAVPQPVAAQQLTAAQTTILKRIVVVASRGSKNVLDVPQTITVIDQATLEKRQVRDIQDLVRYEPGIAVTRQTSITNPWGQLTSFTIRGVGGNRVQMLVDGSRVQEITTDGSRDFVDPWNMKAVELVRGPNSVLTGSDALGGTVSFRTRDPADLLEGQDKPWAVEVKTAWDSYDNSFRKQVTGAYDFGNGLQVLGSLGHMSAEEPKLTKADPNGGIWGCTRPASFRCDKLFPADTSIYNGLLKAVWTPDDAHQFTLTGEFFDRNTEVNQVWDSTETTGVPTGGTNTAGGTYDSVSYIRDLDMTRYRLALGHEWEVGADWLDSVKWNISYSPQRRITDSNQVRKYALRTEERNQLRDYGETFLEADVQLNSSFELLGMSHNLTYGFDGDFTQSSYDGVNTTRNVTTGTVTVTPNQGFNFPEVDTVRADLYLQDEIKLLDERLTLTPGVRIATYSIDPTGDDDYVPLPGFVPQVQESTRLIKRIGAIYELDDSWSVYAGYGEGFKMPTSQQLFVSVNDIFSGNKVIPNPNLRPESVASYEAGFRGEFEKGWLSVGGFYSEYTDFIRSFAPVAGQPANVVTYDNLDTMKLWGIEASAEFEVYENLFASGTLTYSKGVQQANSSSTETPFDGAVPLTLVAGLRYELPDNGLEFEVIGTFASGVTERSDPNAFKPVGYAVFDAYAKWEPAENIELTAGIQNIFDTRYFPNTLTGYANTPDSPAVANVNPLEQQVAPGRTFKVGAKVTF
jgi:hemoglobin/transferrin/lactoferrin receptor protein